MTSPACAPSERHHVIYLSSMLAGNAVILHQLAHPTCEAIEPFECADHFHIGHPTPAIGQRCKAADG